MQINGRTVLTWKHPTVFWIARLPTPQFERNQYSGFNKRDVCNALFGLCSVNVPANDRAANVYEIGVEIFPPQGRNLAWTKSEKTGEREYELTIDMID